MEKRSGQYNFFRVRSRLARLSRRRSRHGPRRGSGLRSATAPIGRGRRPRSRPTRTATPTPTRGASTRSRAFDSLRTLRNFTIATGVTERGRLDAPRVVFTLDSSSRVTLDHSFSYSNACIRHDASTRDDRPDNLHRPVTTGRGPPPRVPSSSTVLDGRRRSDSARRSGARGDAMRGADLEVEDEDEAGAAVVARVVVEDDGGDLKGATPSTTMNAMGESASAASTSDGDDETTVVGARLERCVREILRAMGEDVTREGLLDTPARVAKALTFAIVRVGRAPRRRWARRSFTKTDSSGLCEPKR